MCQGGITELACGHLLVHFSVRCPLNCQYPAVKPAYIEDTCAECHLKYSIEHINMRYDKLEAETRTLYQVAVRENRHDDAEALSKKMAQHGFDRSAELAHAAKRRVSGCTDVIWPGKRFDESS
ncbi:hypothetical protein V8F20_006117 [Naviculisporaceae sp. PSN 640]